MCKRFSMMTAAVLWSLIASSLGAQICDDERRSTFSLLSTPSYEGTVNSYGEMHSAVHAGFAEDKHYERTFVGSSYWLPYNRHSGASVTAMVSVEGGFVDSWPLPVPAPGVGISGAALRLEVRAAGVTLCTADLLLGERITFGSDTLSVGPRELRCSLSEVPTRTNIVALVRLRTWATGAGAAYATAVADVDVQNIRLSHCLAADDIALSRHPTLEAIPLASPIRTGFFNVKIPLVDEFPNWSSSPGVKRLTGDFNGDGWTDLALTGVAGWTTLPVAFSVRDPWEIDFEVTNHPIGAFASWASQAGVVALPGDFDGDGDTDIALTGGSTWTSVRLASSNGDGTFAVTATVIGSGFAAQAAMPGVEHLAGDFNGDGRTDIALLGPATWDSVPVAFSDGDGSFTVTRVVTGFAVWASTPGVARFVGDFDGDGRQDIALVGARTWLESPTLAIAFSTIDAGGAFTFDVRNTLAGEFGRLAATKGARKVAGDFNGDGRTDLALTGVLSWTTTPVAFSGGRGQFTFTNEPTGTFSALATPANVTVLTGFFNGDSKMDIALVGGAGWRTIPVAASLGDGTFTVVGWPVGEEFGEAAAAAGVARLKGNYGETR